MTQSTKSPPTEPFAVRLTKIQKKNIMETSREVGLSFPDTLRKAIDFGLPVLKMKLSSEQTPASPTVAETPQ